MKLNHLSLILILIIGISYVAWNSYIQTQERPTIQRLIIVEDGEAYSVLLHEIESASSKIYVAMYVIKYDPRDADDPVNRLLCALAFAKARGLDVRVLIDDETVESYPDTVKFLKGRDISIKLDEGIKVKTHTKMVIIDGNVLYIGSHNWTESALKHNHEVGVVIRGGDAIAEAEAYFIRLWNAGRPV